MKVRATCAEERDQERDGCIAQHNQSQSDCLAMAKLQQRHLCDNITTPVTWRQAAERQMFNTPCLAYE